MNTSDYIALAALAVSGYAVYQSHRTNARTEAARRESESTQAAAKRRGLVDEVILEAHGLADDVRLHGGEVDKTKRRANDMEIKSGSRENSSFTLIRQSCEGKRIEAEDAHTAYAQPVLSATTEALGQRSIEELESTLRDIKKARGRVRLLIEETKKLLSE